MIDPAAPPTPPPPGLSPRDRLLRALEEDLFAVGVSQPIRVASFLARRCLAPTLSALDGSP